MTHHTKIISVIQSETTYSIMENSPDGTQVISGSWGTPEEAFTALDEREALSASTTTECGAENPDYPGEYRCTFPRGHGPISETNADDIEIEDMDHGSPKAGAYWNMPLKGFSDVTPYEICKRYADGFIDRNNLINELARFPYVKGGQTDGHDSLIVNPAGTWSEVEDAARHGLIDNDVYEEVFNRRHGIGANVICTQIETVTTVTIIPRPTPQ